MSSTDRGEGCKLSAQDTSGAPPHLLSCMPAHLYDLTLQGDPPARTYRPVTHKRRHLLSEPFAGALHFKEAAGGLDRTLTP